MRLGGIILCGGHSRRMGRPKALLPFEGRTMLEIVVHKLMSATMPVAIVAASGQELPPLPADCRVVFDEQPGRGPLEGLRVGLLALQETCDAAFVCGCDAPLLEPAVVKLLASRLGAAQIIAPIEQERRHPLAAIYRTSVAAAAERLLAQGESRLQAIFEAVETRFLDANELKTVDPKLLSLRNLNTPEAYAEAMSGDATKPLY